MNYTAAEINTILITLGSVITIFGGVVVAIVTSIKNQVTKIEAHVNSKATADGAEIRSLQAQLKTVREMMSEKKEIASLLAQAAAVHQPTQPALPVEVTVANLPNDPVPVTTPKK